MPDQHSITLPPLRCRGFARADALAVLFAAVILLAVLIPVATAARGSSRGNQSAANLIQLGQAHDCYAADWDDRQLVALPDDLGVAGGDCATYVADIGCIPPLLLGWDDGLLPAMWGFYVSSAGRCAAASFPAGGCSLIHLRPIAFESILAGGLHRLGNSRPIQGYAGGRFYDPVFFAPNDEPSYSAASQFFDVDAQFPGLIGTAGVAPTSYTLSPAAMLHPDVLRRPSQGGFQSPNSLPHGYEAPRVGQAAHPSLKTRLIEHFWTEGAPAPCNPGFDDVWVKTFSPGCSPYTFSQGAAAVPMTLFFDGSVRRLPTSQAIAADASVRLHSNGDGLWSRDTPFGDNGYLGQHSFDGTTTGHHVLTTDGLLGRDVLK